MPTETTPDGSLAHAASQIVGLLSKEEGAPRSGKPEQTPPKEESTQAPAAPDTADESTAQADTETETESEQAAPEAESEDADAPAPQPRLIPVKIEGKTVMVTEEEAAKSFSREDVWTRKMQALADERRAFEERDVATVRAERAYYAATLDELKSVVVASQPKEPDWAKLRTEVSADEFSAQLLQWKDNQERVAKIDAEKARVVAAQEADAAAGFQKYVAAESERLADALPDFKEPTKAAALKKELGEFAKSRGFTDDDLNGVTDHRVVLLLHDAMQHHKAKAKAPVVRNRIEQSIEASAPGSRTTTPKRTGLAEAQAKVAKTGRLEDAAAAIAHLI
jgi:hypothetical protein